VSGDTLTVLCAGPGLGFYVPGAILARRRPPAEVVVIESLLPPAKQAVVQRSRHAFHHDFRVALMAQRVVRDITPDLDGAKVAALLDGWRRAGRRRFACFSGFWMPILGRYLAEVDGASADLCHVDAAPSSSWTLVPERHARMRDRWFLSWAERRQCLRLDIDGQSPLPWSARSGRLLAHGGGWGMGTYRERVQALPNVALDVLGYEPSDLEPARPDRRSLYLDPDWFPWRLAPGASPFPPLGEVGADGAMTWRESHDFPELYRVTRSASAVISKPGGGTLIDCFAAATPLLLVEPFGDYERKGGALWKELGFALELEDWIADGCRMEALRALHENLLAARPSVEILA
jgi:hypothetical protein